MHLSGFYDEIHSTETNATRNSSSNLKIRNPNYQCDPNGKSPTQGAYSLLRAEGRSLEVSGSTSPQYTKLSETGTDICTKSIHLQVPEITICHPLPPGHPPPNVKPSAATRGNGNLPPTFDTVKDLGNSPESFNVQSKTEQEIQGQKAEVASLGHYSLAGSESHYSLAQSSDNDYCHAESQEGEKDCLDELAPADYEEFYSTVTVHSSESEIMHSSESEEESAEDKEAVGLQIMNPMDSIYSNISSSSYYPRHSATITETGYQDQLVKEKVLKDKRPVSAMVESHRLYQLQQGNKKPFIPDSKIWLTAVGRVLYH